MTTTHRGSVVVTGGSSGIGKATALHLRGLGFSVWAGVRGEDDARRMLEYGLTPIQIDVTKPEQLAAARAELGDLPLAGLVNNAGITRGGPLEAIPLADLREQFEVNVIGQVAVTQTFIHALRAGRGRIINVGSIAGRFAIPIIGPYVASKFALEGITDTLRRELVLRGVDVILMESGGVRTPIMRKTTHSINRVYRESPPELRQCYAPMLAAAFDNINNIERHTGMDADKVARVIGKALLARRPRTRYVVGQDAVIAAMMAKLLPDRVIDRLLLRKVKP